MIAINHSKIIQYFLMTLLFIGCTTESKNKIKEVKLPSSSSSAPPIILPSSSLPEPKESTSNMMEQKPTIELLAGSGKVGNKLGPAKEAQFSQYLRGVCQSPVDKKIYIVDHTIVKKLDENQEVTVFAGDSRIGYVDSKNPLEARFKSLTSCVFDTAGNMYLPDSGNYVIRKITPQGEVSTFAGNGQVGSEDGDLLTASFTNPLDIAISNDGSFFIADYFWVRKIQNGVVSTLNRHQNTIRLRYPPVYSNSSLEKSSFGHLWTVAVDENNNVFVGDHTLKSVHLITNTNKVFTLLNKADIDLTSWVRPFSLTYSNKQKKLYLLYGDVFVIPFDPSNFTFGEQTLLTHDQPFPGDLGDLYLNEDHDLIVTVGKLNQIKKLRL